MTPLFKKADSFDKVNYTLVSLLSHVLKVYENYFQLIQSVESYFSSFLTGFHNTQHSLLKILELWKESLDKGKSFGAIFMGLFKAFDTLNHDLLIAKLEGYGFSENLLNYIQSYLRTVMLRLNARGVY